MLARGEGEGGRLAAAAHLDIAALVGADGHVGQRDVGQFRERGVERAGQLALPVLAVLDEGLVAGHRVDEALGLGLVALRLGLADGLRGGVAFVLGVLQGLQVGAARLVEGKDALRLRRGAAAGERRVERGGILADEANVEHGTTR